MLMVLRVLGGLLGTAQLIGAAVILVFGSDNLGLRIVYAVAWLGAGLVFIRYAVKGRQGEAISSRKL